MSAILHLIRPHTRDIGFPVKRLLPSAATQTVGPFIFLDHMGPMIFEAAGHEGDVRPHPHIGLATVTYLFSGAMMHRDSLGHVQRIEPGDVNWMSAGSGIVHSERVPADVRTAGLPVEGIQMWVALSKADEDGEPGFWHYPATDLPWVEGQGVRAHVLVGQAFGVTSPVPTSTDTLYAAVDVEADVAFDLPPDHIERGVYLVSGSLVVDGQLLEAGQLAVLKPWETVTLETQDKPARFMLLGGDPLDGPRFIWWNFVASTRERIEEAKARWQAEAFEPVPGETERIPLPLR